MLVLQRETASSRVAGYRWQNASASWYFSVFLLIRS
ncbi:hypothetical protein SLEP1_g22519 [Rubroshorea leprosula]|uniref:Uncharacterized protein n=1 Tax=Rubroshorea leprosula TaxID=152421 RepID=A0AAV5JIP7_9ROSI|nr:hypothetical protein SLEP1_g22519 [Rubroshorea leprosula]